MAHDFGTHIRLSLFGASHGAGVGCVLSGLPAGFPIHWALVSAEMARRRPGQGPLTTSRNEKDGYTILSGIFEGRTTGAPLTAFIENEDQQSRDYEPEIPRPGHGDGVARLRYGGYADTRGGGTFSGRMTAPLVLAGAIAKQIIGELGVQVAGRIHSIGGIPDGRAAARDILHASEKPFPVTDDGAGAAMEKAILQAKGEGDSVGGVIECVALSMPAGVGDPLFGSLKGQIAGMMLSLPAIKAIEFGDGFALSAMRGSQANDAMVMEGGKLRHLTNHNGGILGGISNGEDIVLRVAVKPTPTIRRPQQTVNLSSGANIIKTFGGRHDPCIVPRAVPVVEAAFALCLLDALTGAHLIPKIQEDKP